MSILLWGSKLLRGNEAPQGGKDWSKLFSEEDNAKKKLGNKDGPYGPLQDKNGEFYAIKGIRTLFEKLGYLDKPNTSIKSSKASKASPHNEKDGPSCAIS